MDEEVERMDGSIVSLFFWWLTEYFCCCSFFVSIPFLVGKAYLTFDSSLDHSLINRRAPHLIQDNNLFISSTWWFFIFHLVNDVIHFITFDRSIFKAFLFEFQKVLLHGYQLETRITRETWSDDVKYCHSWNFFF